MNEFRTGGTVMAYDLSGYSGKELTKWNTYEVVSVGKTIIKLKDKKGGFLKSRFLPLEGKEVEMRGNSFWFDELTETMYLMQQRQLAYERGGVFVASNLNTGNKENRSIVDPNLVMVGEQVCMGDTVVVKNIEELRATPGLVHYDGTWSLRAGYGAVLHEHVRHYPPLQRPFVVSEANNMSIDGAGRYIVAPVNNRGNMDHIPVWALKIVKKAQPTVKIVPKKGTVVKISNPKILRTHKVLSPATEYKVKELETASNKSYLGIALADDSVEYCESKYFKIVKNGKKIILNNGFQEQIFKVVL